MLPSQLYSCLPQLSSATLGERCSVLKLEFPGPRLQGDASRRGSWQYSPSLRAPACAQRGTRTAPRKRRGGGFEVGRLSPSPAPARLAARWLCPLAWGTCPCSRPEEQAQ